METRPYNPDENELQLRAQLLEALSLPRTLPVRSDDRNMITPGIRSLVTELGLHHEIWDNISDLLRRKSVHVQDYSVEYRDRIRLTAAAAFCTTRSVAETMEVELTTAHKIMQEVAAAAVFVMPESPLRYEHLGSEGRHSHETFRYVKDRQDEALAILCDPSFGRELRQVPPFGQLTQAVAEEGTILFMLNDLGIRYGNIDNLSRTFSKFLSEGSVEGGNLMLLRRVLYAKWLKNPPLHNFAGIDVRRLTENMAGWVFSVAPEKDRQTGTAKRNIRNFLRYAAACSLQRNINNHDMHALDLSSVFPVISVDGDAPFGYTDLYFDREQLTDDSSRQLSSFRLSNGRYGIRLDTQQFYHGAAYYYANIPIEDFMYEYLHDYNRRRIVGDIASTLVMSEDSTRKTYDAGLQFCDWLVMTDRDVFQPASLLRDFRHYSIPASYERIKRLLQDRAAANGHREP
ncbi:MAG: hypothetical protein TR69_WS6001000874 [candidate division WS6 bacterium OLB20]|uniref:Uncharacterized protein n=1 Tax=candidate division WS6 bacterium OLB20 TaxID=1617426 RepID=A0A136LYX5_9BACT|nr:MAG: hypothetical protein TR69_WS6001000874 [candidate division WS6 bacterium OLB20]